MIWEATRAEMAERLGKPLPATVPGGVAGGDVAAKEGGAGAEADEEDAGGIDKAAFVCLMVKVHHLIICPPVRFYDTAILERESPKAGDYRR